MTSKSEIESLIVLMEDPDPFIQESVQSRFSELGENAVPLLDEYRMELKDPDDKKKVGDIIHHLTFETLKTDFHELLEKGVKNRAQLEDAAFTLARFGNPTLRSKEFKQRLDHYAEMVEPTIRYRLDERRKMKQLIKFVFEDLNFSGDTEDYHNPANCFIDQVISRRRGLPITLSMIVMFIARRLDMPFYGVNMPIHFMLNYIGEKEEVLVDPYDNGAIVTYDQCYFFLKKNNIEPRPEHFKMASDMDILTRCIRNLIHSYERKEMPKRIEDLKKLLSIAESYED
jgi:regulator of sirC expression with transglutaminase-like and TPR domain